jgi:hypothetical protein
MKKYLFTIALAASLFVFPAAAQDSKPSAPSARKDCEELKKEIAAKLDEKGVKNYTLDIVKTEDVKDAQVVGSCDGGTKKITYKRN